MFFVSQLSGEISTKPLLNIIAKTSSQFSWLGILINIFIMASITVSFVTVGTAMKHVLDGFVCSLTVKLKATAGTFLKDFVINLHINWKNGIVYFFFFGLVLLLAQIFPKGFFSILQRVTSLALNLESGVFVCIMLNTARRAYSTKIPVALYTWIFHLRFFVFVYFTFAIGYDVVTWILDLVNLGGYV